MLETRKLNPLTAESYIHTLKMMHELSKMDSQVFSNPLVKLTIRGASNLQLYEKPSRAYRNVVTLPMLRIIGHRNSGAGLGFPNQTNYLGGVLSGVSWVPQNGRNPV